MKILFTRLISLTIIFALSLGNPIDSPSQEQYASLQKDFLQIADKMEILIEKSLPQLPTGEEYEHFRTEFQSFLKKKRLYASITPGENCENKILSFFDDFADILKYFVLRPPRSAIAEQIVQIFNANGMEKIKADVENLVATNIKRSDFEKYLVRNC
ncbi:uncharacterized protein LOC101889521 [Musca domestica]|uniref:Uncharacterized protein LOC101889521 n=1 Tax=Musca domestica TaxID=7370 RepID=A0A1I8NBX7_MUSDO|nr:uncharacterized protein LOC101889521 [Musca domestica]